MPSGVTIRAASIEDATEIQQIARRSWHDAYEEILTADRIEALVDEWYAPRRLIEDDITESTRPFIVATIGDEVIGFAEAAPQESDEGAAELYRIYVDPDHWDSGIGKLLLEEVQETLRERGFDTLGLTVFAENSVGVGFYESMGFVRVDTEYSERFDARQYRYVKEL